MTQSLHLPQAPADQRQRLLQLLAERAYRHGSFTLASGRSSDHYVNCKPVSLSGEGLALLSARMLELVEAEAVAVAGLTLGADPLVSGVAQAAALAGRQLDALIVRKEAKGHGTGAWLEGPLPAAGSRITVLEDVVTTGLSSREAIAAVAREGGEVIAECAIIDRSCGSVDLGVPFYPLLAIDFPTYDESDIPEALAAVEVTKPGSRKE